MEYAGEYDAVVLGAGVGGAALAAALAAEGWRVLAVDRDVFPRHKVCGEFVSPEAIGMLEALGVRLPTGEEPEAVPAHIRQVRLHAGTDCEPLAIPLAGAALGWSRYALDIALHEAARKAGAGIVTGTTVTAAHPLGHNDGWTLKLKRSIEKDVGTVLQARIVIAAWGRNPRAGLPGSEASAKLRGRAVHVGVKLHLTGAWPGEPAVDMLFDRAGYLGAAPVEGGRINVAALMDRESFKEAGGTPIAAIRWLADRHPQLRRLLSGGTPIPDTVLAVSPVAAARMPLAWDGLPRIGDAAAFIPPLCGDGMAMALRSAQLCAKLADECLRGRLSPAEWERRYRAALGRELAAPIRWGRLLHAALRHPPLARMLLALGGLAPAVPQYLIRSTRLRG